jgi:hypothetical protein
MENWERDLISETEFTDTWGAHVKESGDLFFLEDVKNLPIQHVWTVCDSGGGTPDHWIAAPGFHAVNVLGYVLTRKPWNDDTQDAFYVFDDFEQPDDSDAGCDS